MTVEAVAMPANVAARPGARARGAADTYCLTDLPSLEAALERGLLQGWNRVVGADPLSSVYQSPGWCMPWYRCYRDSFDPCVIVVSDASGVAGVVPMAVDRKSRELVFASNTMADYRDIVALPGRRADVMAALIACYVKGGFAGPLRIGWIDPASDTPALAAQACRAMGIHHSVHHQPCWRWFPVDGENIQKKFSRLKTHLNYFKRQGEVAFEIVTAPGEWRAFSVDFFRQHSLRQLQAAREVSFDDPRKQQLYDALFDTPGSQVHVSACRVNGRLVAGHIGTVWRGVLQFGAPSINIEDEHRSPALILMTWMMQNAAQLGLSGVDFTIGDGEFKRRLGNRCVQLSMIEVYARSREYHLQRARARGVQTARSAFERIMGPGAWAARVKPAAAAMSYKRRRLGELGLRAAAARAARLVVGRPAAEVAYWATADSLRALAPDAAESAHEMHENRVEDLLLWDGASPSTVSALNACARAYARNRASGHTLHTLVAGAELAAWCFAGIEGDGGTVVMSDVCATPAASGTSAYDALVRRVAGAWLGRGATGVRVVVREDDRPLRGALAALGFRIEAAE